MLRAELLHTSSYKQCCTSAEKFLKGRSAVIPVKVRAHIPKEVEGQLARLLLAVELIAILRLPQLVRKGVAQLVLAHVLLQTVQAPQHLGISFKAGAAGPLVAALAAALVLH